MKTVVFAGGMGSRLSEETSARPKPMVEIGDEPILWHLLQYYSAYGFNEFVIALGYKGDVIKRYFLDFLTNRSDLSVDFRDATRVVHRRELPEWQVHLVDTGTETLTGGRLLRTRAWLGETTFMATYADGLSDVDLEQLVKFHRAHGKIATVTAVHPPSAFGTLAFDGDRVVEFLEKPELSSAWINGGFFVVEPAVFDYIQGDGVSWEDVLELLTADGELMAFRHSGFFQPMDTISQRKTLENLWKTGSAPWKVV